ncbi:biotin-dependent carboxyltransferase family protein [Streptomyces sp. BI20]|uniref:5-oxoprolinase subunit C family protein n=1 Tax=Streptomyces sp. BI20 TaxID=3403460 RepID=UPI003C710BC3
MTVVRAGALTTVQDAGRAGWARLGVPRSGALDRGAHACANRLVGNPADAAGLETTLDGVGLRTGAEPVVLAVVGAPCAVRAGGRPAPWGAPFRVPARTVVEVGPAVAGVRAYVAVRGGFAVPETLGSRSTDLLSGLGPAPLAVGDELPVGPAPLAPPDRTPPALPAPPVELVLPVHPGPRADWFTAASVRALWAGTHRVSATSNRIGLRTEPESPLVRAREGDLPSEGVVLGAVQVPPDGRPLVFLADHPVTGGYPVLGVVPAAALDRAAQARPGARLRFVPAR